MSTTEFNKNLERIWKKVRESEKAITTLNDIFREEFKDKDGALVFLMQNHRCTPNSGWYRPPTEELMKKHGSVYREQWSQTVPCGTIMLYLGLREPHNVPGGKIPTWIVEQKLVQEWFPPNKLKAVNNEEQYQRLLEEIKKNEKEE